MRNLVGKADSMAKYSFLRVDGGRREKRMMNHGLVGSHFLNLSIFSQGVCVNSFVYLRTGFRGEEISS